MSIFYIGAIAYLLLGTCLFIKSESWLERLLWGLYLLSGITIGIAIILKIVI